MRDTIRFGAALAAAVLLSSPSVSRAQDPPPAQPAGPPAGTPTTSSQAPPPDTHKLRTATEEEEEQVTPPPEPEVIWGIGARARFITIPTFVFDLFVDHSTGLNAFSVAGSVIRRNGNFDIVMTLEYASTSPDDGLWQEKDEVPGMANMDPDLVVFDGLSQISADVSFIWHAPLTDFMAFRYGAGIGIGVPIGGYTHTDTVCPAGTRIDDLDNPSQCPVAPGARVEDDNLPPVVPIVNLLAGLRFKVADQFSIDVELGWRFPAFFAGAGIGYFF